jgi:hypothetical protein
MTIHVHGTGARDSVVRSGTMLQEGRSRARVPMRCIFFQLTRYFQPHYVPGVDSASNRNEYQESSWGVKSGRRVSLTTLWASTACCRDSFTFYVRGKGHN